MKNLLVEILPTKETEESLEFQDDLRPEYDLSQLRRVNKQIDQTIKDIYEIIKEE